MSQSNVKEIIMFDFKSILAIGLSLVLLFGLFVGSVCFHKYVYESTRLKLHETAFKAGYEQEMVSGCHVPIWKKEHGCLLESGLLSQ